MHILVIEDDAAIAANLYDFLSTRGHQVDAAGDARHGLQLATTQPFDGILLDLALPGMGGLIFCRELREQARVDTPILILTARDTLEDKLKGFEHGADDYLVKPFALKEVEARLLALHKRRSGRLTERVLRSGDLELDLRAFTVHVAGAPVKLPPKCVRLLERLMLEPGRVHSRDELENSVWGEAQHTSDTLRTHMHTLRRALTEAGGRDPIETVHGVGYRLAAHA